MLNFFLLSGIFLDILAIIALHDDWSLLIVFLLHALASYCVIMSVHQKRADFTQYNYQITAMLFLLVFFVPVLGIVSTLVLTRWLRQSQKNYRTQTISTLKENQQINPLREHYAVGGLNYNLQTSDSSLQSRIQALKVMSTIPAEKSNVLIRNILSDKQDELRLLAFNMLNKQEKIFISEISRGLEKLKEETDAFKIAQIQKWIGIQYWELAYRHLVETHLINTILTHSLNFTQAAEAELPNDVGIQLLLGNIFIYKKNYDLAIHYFYQALAKGIAKSRVTPYLIEAYFYKREFNKIRELVKTEINITGSIVSDPISEFWNQSYG